MLAVGAGLGVELRDLVQPCISGARRGLLLSLKSRLPPRMNQGEEMNPEAKARVSIDALLVAAGWHVCDMAQANIHAARGVT